MKIFMPLKVEESRFYPGMYVIERCCTLRDMLGTLELDTSPI
jgi:hypothetical protein